LRELYESDEAQALAAPPNAAELLRLKASAGKWPEHVSERVVDCRPPMGIMRTVPRRQRQLLRCG
jgi:hypothetical protein